MKIVKTFATSCLLIIAGLLIGFLNIITIKHFAYYTHDKAAVEVLMKGIMVYIMQPFFTFSFLFLGIRIIAKRMQVK